MSLTNPSAPVVDLVHGFDNLIPVAFTDYLLSKPLIAQAFNSSIFPYNRFDISSRGLPAINSYPVTAEGVDNSYWHVGNLMCDVVFPTNVVKGNKLQSALNVIDALLLQIKQDAISSMVQLYPSLIGLQFFGFKYSIDYRGLYDDNPIRSKIALKLEYKINITTYWNWLINNGYDFSSPDQIIFNELTSIFLDVEPQEQQ